MSKTSGGKIKDMLDSLLGTFLGEGKGVLF